MTKFVSALTLTRVHIFRVYTGIAIEIKKERIEPLVERRTVNCRSNSASHSQVLSHSLSESFFSFKFSITTSFANKIAFIMHKWLSFVLLLRIVKLKNLHRTVSLATKCSFFYLGIFNCWWPTCSFAYSAVHAITIMCINNWWGSNYILW